MRHHVLQAVKPLEKADGYDPEVIDLISLKPFLDFETIGNFRIRKTHRVIIVEECMRSGGIGAVIQLRLLTIAYLTN